MKKECDLQKMDPTKKIKEQIWKKEVPELKEKKSVKKISQIYIGNTNFLKDFEKFRDFFNRFFLIQIFDEKKSWENKNGV